MCITTPMTTEPLPSAEAAPAGARAFVLDRLCRTHAADAEAAAMLLASELVADALSCGEVPGSITVECREGEVSIEVASRSTDAATQHGWQRDLRAVLLDKVSRSWGRDRVGDEVVRWCTVPTGTLPSYHPGRRRLAVVGGTPGRE